MANTIKARAQDNQTQINQGMLLGLMGVIVFSFTLPVTRYIVPYMDPMFIGMARSVVTSIVAAIILLALKQKLPNKKQTIQLLVTAGGVVIGFPVLSALGMQTVPASHGSVITGLLPLLTVVFAVILVKEKPSIGFWITGFLGAGLVITYSLIQGGLKFNLGHLYLIGSSIIGALGYAMGGKVAKQLGGWQVICWGLVLSFPLTLLCLLILLPEDIMSYPKNVYLGFFYLALGSQLFGFFFWDKGLVLGGISRVSQMQLLQPFLSILASILILGEIIELKTYFFAFAVIACIAISRKIAVTTK